MDILEIKEEQKIYNTQIEQFATIKEINNDFIKCIINNEEKIFEKNHLLKHMILINDFTENNPKKICFVCGGKTTSNKYFLCRDCYEKLSVLQMPSILITNALYVAFYEDLLNETDKIFTLRELLKTIDNKKLIQILNDKKILENTETIQQYNNLKKENSELLKEKQELIEKIKNIEKLKDKEYNNLLKKYHNLQDSYNRICNENTNLKTLINDFKKEEEKNSKWETESGHYADSQQEKIIADKLWHEKIRYSMHATLYIKPDIRKITNLEKFILCPDFYLPDYDVYIEYFGITNNSKYQEIKNKKIKIYDELKKENKKFIYLYPEDTKNNFSIYAKLEEVGIKI